MSIPVSRHSGESAAIPEISRGEIERRLEDPTLALINVLPWEAFAAGHIPGSRNLPVSEVAARARNVLEDPAQEIAVYCGSAT